MLKKFFSHEQIDKLLVYKNMIREYHDSLHLVSDRLLNELDEQIIDSVYLWNFIEETPTIIDVGSGNGLLGIVLGIKGASGLLVDTNKKKAAFLDLVVKNLRLSMSVVASSIRNIESANQSWIIAKGFGPLVKCLAANKKLWNKNTSGLFIKSESVQKEIDDALAKGWKFKYTIHHRHIRGTIVKIEDVEFKENSGGSKSKRRSWKNNNSGKFSC
ncbi:MAG: class I SAM-dependent methyltransferase [Alphaproteobacteria bacterium]|nr:MAG: class I SAM-dependent methyltransferase [Alphaproteobacteria bacterium]